MASSMLRALPVPVERQIKKTSTLKNMISAASWHLWALAKVDCASTMSRALFDPIERLSVAQSAH